MRTTLTLDPDVATKAKKGAAKLHKPFKEVINAALRVGLDEVLKPPPARPYRTTAMEHNSILASTDADFARFRGLRWRNPIA